MIAAASAAALALGVGVATASTALGATSHTLTVWLQVDAQNGWPQLVTAANNQFESQNPGWTVNIDYQQWSTHLGNFNATIAGGNEPDVIEMGNTETTSYMASGAFAPLNASQFPNSSHWLGGLKASGTYMGKLYAVPYYAGSRVVTYRADLFKKAGIKKAPTSLAQMQADLVKVGKKEKKVKGFSPLYVGGEDWYTALSFVFDHHGSIAKYEHGKWVGTLDSKNSIAGLTAYLNFFNATEPKSTAKLDGTSPYAYTVYSEGKTAAMYGPAWFKGSVTNKKYLADTKQMVMPSYVKGQPMPGFLGGSDLAIPAKSSNQSQAAQWIADYTSTTSEQGLQTAGNIPNATNLLTKGDVNDEAAAQSWFVPQAVNWVEVENANILKTLLGDMLTGQLSVKQAATTASENIAQTLNQPAS
ncbi:MAG: extracellular solute-binding protein [Conexibacteraceae bacterium]|nr:extracellular solute-binding protein [Conexibacteraceae bacterium]